MSSNLFCSNGFPGENLLVFQLYEYGGGYRGSIATLIVFYINVGIILDRTDPSTSKQGFELASIKNGFILASSIKSSPNN